MAVMLPLIASLLLTDVSNNSVAAGDFVGMVDVDLEEVVINRIDPDDGDIVVKARVIDETGAEVVAPFTLTATKGGNNARFHGLLTVPSSVGAKTLILQAYIAKDIKLPGTSGRELDQDDFFVATLPFRYLA